MELKKLSTSKYWILKIGYRVCYFLCYYLLAFIYGGKGKVVPPVRNPLLLKSATQLAKEIRENKLKSESVVIAYIERIAEVEPYINALCENRFREAINDAKNADFLIQSGKFTMQQLEEEKPLLGVPFTTKVLLTVKGLHSSASSKLFKDVIAAEDAPTIALLKNAGAIVLATTSSAEFGLGFDTINSLRGKTCNPYDTNRTAGGSSGGESALIGAAGSVIGLGNDITGSIRVPAHFTGIFSHKPTLDMVPNGGSFPGVVSKLSKYLYTGPMCRYSEDLITMMKVLTSKNKQRMKFDQPVNFRNLKIYYQIDLLDPLVYPVENEIRQAMRKAIAHFIETYGIEAKEVNISLLNISNLIECHLILGDIPNVTAMVTAGKITHMNGVLELLKFLIGKSDYDLWTIIELGFGKYPIFYSDDDVPLYRNLLKKLDEKFDSLLDENSVFFFPTLPVSAPYFYQMIPLIFSTIYTGIFNFLGLPVTQCPLGLNRDGLPQGMQIIAKKNNDPLALACAVELGKAFGGWIPPKNY